MPTRTFALLVAASLGLPAAAQHVDVLVFESESSLGVGEFNLDDFSAREERVFPARFDEFYAVNSPGFFSRSGDLPGAADLGWDFLPMIDPLRDFDYTPSTLLYWDNEASATPTFGPAPAGHSLTLFGKDGGAAAADGGDELVPGATIETTSPNGAMHQHRFFFLDDNGDGLNTTLPATGVYLLAMRLRMDGLDASEPFFFVWATPETSVLPAIQPAVAWVESRVDTLVPLEGDFNYDGRVDAADYPAWRNGLGDRFEASDLDLWRANYDATLPGLSGAASAVPEPGALGLLVLSAAVGALSARRRPAELPGRTSQ